MTKGTSSMGKKSGKVGHFRCRRCGNHSYHVRDSVCASCGYGKSPKMRKYNWRKKA
jgi:large subunit ribosomal protein L37e